MNLIFNKEINGAILKKGLLVLVIVRFTLQKCFLFTPNGSNCLVCDINYYSKQIHANLSQGFPIEFCLPRKNLINSKLIFVSDTESCDRTLCDGSQEQPYKYLSDALIKEYEKGVSYVFSDLKFFVFSKSQLSFLFPLDPLVNYQLYRQMDCSIAISPGWCEEFPNIKNCIPKDSKLKLILKTNQISIFIFRRIKLNSLIIEGIDLFLDSLNSCLLTEEQCCEISGSGGSKKIYCGSQKSLIKVSSVSALRPFFCIEFVGDSLPEINIESSELRSLPNPGFLTFIKSDFGFPFHLSVRNSSFVDVFLAYALFEIQQASYLMYSINDTSPPIVEISGCNFTDFNALLGGEELSVFKLTDFLGQLTVKDCVFLRNYIKAPGNNSNYIFNILQSKANLSNYISILNALFQENSVHTIIQLYDVHSLLFILDMELINNLLFYGVKLAYMSHVLISIKLSGVLPETSLISSLFSKINITNSRIASAFPSNITTAFIIYCESNYPTTLKELFKQKYGSEFTTVDEIYISNMEVYGGSDYSFIGNKHSVQQLYIVNSSFRQGNFSKQEFILASVEGRFIFSDSVVSNIKFYSSFIVIDPAYNFSLSNTVFMNLSFFDALLVNMKSVTQFNEYHIFNFTNLVIKNIDILYVDLTLVNSTIKRILLAGGYDLSGEGCIMVIHSVYIINIRFEYYNENSLVFYSPSGYLLVDKLYISNVTNTTIFYFLVTITDGRLVITNTVASLEQNKMARFIRISIETYYLAIIERFFLLGNIFMTNSIMLLNNPKIFSMKSSLISASCERGAQLVINVYSVFTFLLRNCTFSGELSLAFRETTSAILYSARNNAFNPDSFRAVSLNSSSEFGIIDCAFSFFTDSVIKVAQNSEIVLIGVEASFCLGMSGGFLDSEMNSKINLINFAFKNIYVFQDGGVIDSQYTLVIMKNGISSNILSLRRGSLINANFCDLDIANISATNVTSRMGGLVAVEFTVIQVLSCTVIDAFSETYGGVFMVKSTNLSLSDSSFTNSTAADRGAVLYSENSYILVKNSIFFRSYSQLAACLFLNVGLLEMEACDFLENYSGSGTIILSYDASYRVIRSKFKNNSATAGSLFVSHSSFAPRSGSILLDLFFIGNNLKEGGVFYLKEFDMIMEATDYKETGLQFILVCTKSLIKIINIYFITDSEIKGNPTQLGYYLLRGKDAEITVNLSFLFCNLFFAGVICEHCNYLKIFGLFLEKSVAINGAAVKVDRTNTILIGFCKISDTLTFDGGGGSIHAMNSVFLAVFNCIFKGNAIGVKKYPADIYVSTNFDNGGVQQPVFNLTNSLFENSGVLSLRMTKINVFLKGIIATGGSETFGQSISCIDCYNFYILSCVIRNINLGGIITLKNSFHNTSYVFNISDSKFSKSSSLFSGGALSVSGFVSLSIERTIFEGISSEGSGGAIFFLASSNSHFTVYGSIFVNCRSLKKGGAIFSTLSSIQIDEHSSFVNNTAIAGMNVASSFSKFVMQSEVLNFMKNETLDLRIGQKVDINITIFDQYENILYDSEDMLLKLSLEVPKELNISLRNNMIWIREGKGFLRDFTITAGKFYQDILVKAAVISRNSPDLINYYSISLKSCQIGEVFIENSCIKCPENFYSLSWEPSREDLNFCSECPKNALCSGGYSLLPKPGYWRSQNHSIIVKCYDIATCPQSQVDFRSDQQCGLGFKGNICGLCESSLTLFLDVCERCKESSVYWVLIIIGLLIFFSFLFLTKLSMMSDYDNERYKDIQVMMKILVNHFSHISVLTIFDLQIIDDFSNLFNTELAYKSTNPQIILSQDCFFNLGLDASSLRAFVFIGFSPFYLFILFGIIQYLLARAQRLIKRLARFFCPSQFDRLDGHNAVIPYESFKIEIILNFGVLIMNLYTSLMIKMFEPLRCIELIPGNTYMKLNPDVKCWSSEHKTYLAWATSFILIWGMGFPLFLFLLSRSCLDLQVRQWKKYNPNKQDLMPSVLKRMAIKKLKSFHEFAPEKSTSNDAFQKSPQFSNKIYGNKSIRNFVFMGYRIKFYFWEAVVYLRKFFLILVSLLKEFLDTIALSGLFISVFLIFLFVNEILIIYESPTLRKYEGMSIIIMIFSFCLALATTMRDIYTNVRLVFLIAIFLINFFFVVSWVIFYLKSSKLLFKERKSLKIQIKKRLAFTDKNKNS